MELSYGDTKVLLPGVCCWCSAGLTSKAICFLEEGRFFFARKREEKKGFGCFVRLLGVFLLHVCVLWGCFLFFARQHEFFGFGGRGVFFRRHTTPKRGNPALTTPQLHQGTTPPADFAGPALDLRVRRHCATLP